MMQQRSICPSKLEERRRMTVGNQRQQAAPSRSHLTHRRRVRLPFVARRAKWGENAGIGRKVVRTLRMRSGAARTTHPVSDTSLLHPHHRGAAALGLLRSLAAFESITNACIPHASQRPPKPFSLSLIPTPRHHLLRELPRILPRVLPPRPLSIRRDQPIPLQQRHIPRPRLLQRE